MSERDKVELYRDVDGKWRWSRIARNGETVSLSSESYERHIDALNEARREFGEDVEYVEGDG